jgi:hypothetical protein
VAKVAIAATWLSAGAAVLLNRVGEPDVARVLEGAILILNLIPVAVGMLVCLAIALGLHLGLRSLMEVWLLLVLVLSIPYWILFERRWLAWLRLHVGREADYRMAAREGAGPSMPPRKHFSAPLGIVFTGLVALGVFLDNSKQARMIEGALLILSTLPEVVAASVRYLLTHFVVDIGPRWPMLIWLLLVLGLSVPYWLWLQARWRKWLELKVNEEIESRRNTVDGA